MLEKNNSVEPIQIEFRSIYSKLINLKFNYEGRTHAFHFVPDDFSDEGVSSVLINEITSYIDDLTGKKKYIAQGGHFNVDEIELLLNKSYSLDFGYLFCTDFERSEPITKRWTSEEQQKLDEKHPNGSLDKIDEGGDSNVND